MRTDELEKVAKRRKLDLVLVADQANIRALTGINCDNAILQLATRNSQLETLLYTDFRYMPMVHRVAPELKCGDIKRLGVGKRRPRRFERIGYESSISHAKFLDVQTLIFVLPCLSPL